MTDLATTKAKLELRRTNLRIASARLRNNQRKEQRKRLEKIGGTVEASWGRKLTPEDVEMLGRVLALASSSGLTLAQLLGSTVKLRDSLAGPNGEQTRRSINDTAAALVDGGPPRLLGTAPVSQ